MANKTTKTAGVMCEGKKTGELDISEATQENIMNMATREIE